MAEDKMTDLFEKLEQMVWEMVGEGKMSENEGKKLVDEVVDKSKEQAESIRETVKDETRKALAAMGVATREDIKRLEEEVEKLRQAVDDLIEG